MGHGTANEVRMTVCPRCGHDARIVVVRAGLLRSRCYVCDDTMEARTAVRPPLGLVGAAPAKGRGDR
jgi:hypothetical protein